MTQCEQILSHLRTGKGITPLDALREFGCFRLAARIAELREQGHDVRTHTVPTASGKRIAMYVMADA